MVENSFDKFLASNAIIKSLPGLVTKLNVDVWGRAGGVVDDEGDVEISNLDEWVLCDGTLCRLADAEAAGKDYMTLKPDLLLMHIQQARTGEELGVDADMEKATTRSRRQV